MSNNSEKLMILPMGSPQMLEGSLPEGKAEAKQRPVHCFTVLLLGAQVMKIPPARGFQLLQRSTRVPKPTALSKHKER